MKISNATVTSKQNFIEKYHRLMKNLYNQNCSSKNKGNKYKQGRGGSEGREGVSDFFSKEISGGSVYLGP